ncbi:MAG: 2-oxoacid:acceptor oxidoreductase subunit alpha, partial [Planctomycetes bacterium]|nr:2-oxoacid:acceptor oxidoreductase subunit alpha [Planctomycetota bacterium]
SFFAGYPITPSTAIAEYLARELPKLTTEIRLRQGYGGQAQRGVFIQMEDEIASLMAVFGASWAGRKAMTATSGPGFSLMSESIGFGIVTETPCVIVNVQRGGPSTGLPTLVAQGDMMQARWGSHGHYEIIALCPASPQEMFDLTVKAFNLAEEFRTPVLVMADEVVGHMTERVAIPSADRLKLFPRRYTSQPPDKYLPFKGDNTGVPAMVKAGDGYHIHITGLTHDAKGYPQIDAETHHQMVDRLINKIRNNARKIIMVEEVDTRDADVIVCSYGISARTSILPIEQARKEGIKVGLLRLITAWPFPEEKIRQLAKKTKAFVVPELNYGQIVLEVERCAAGKAKVVSVPHAGGDTHKPEEILKAIRRV